MEYKKKFNKDKTKVTIKMYGENDLWDLGVKEWVQSKTFKVVNALDVYKKIKEGKPIDISGRYVEGFSLSEYRKIYNINPNEFVPLREFNAVGTFFEVGEDGIISFLLAQFINKAVSFQRASFGNGATTFAGADFAGVEEIDFKYAQFGNGYKNFNQITFKSGKVEFSLARFGTGGISFIKTTFGNCSVSFEGTRFKEGDITFRGSSVGFWGITFEGSTFGESNLLFSPATIGRHGLNLKDTRGSGIWYLGLKSHLIDLSSANIKGSIDFYPYLAPFEIPGLTGILIGLPEEKVNIEELRVINTKCTGKIYLDYDEFGLENSIKKQNTTHKEKAEQFRLFKENLRSLGQYDDEDKAYYWFKYYQIRAEKAFRKGDSLCNKIKKSLIYGFKWSFFEKMGKYGTSPRNVGVSMITVWLIWTLIYLWKFYLIGMKRHNLGSLNLINKLGLSMYHSAITFLTIGYGDIYPMGSLRLWSSIEGFLGLFLMAYFTISFARKVLR